MMCEQPLPCGDLPLLALEPYEGPARSVRESFPLAWSDAMFELGGERLAAPAAGCRAEIGAVVFEPREPCFYVSRHVFAPSDLEPMFGVKVQYIGQLEAYAAAAVDTTFPDVVGGRKLISR